MPASFFHQQKSSLRNLMEETFSEKTFFPTIDDVDEWYTRINLVVFRNELIVPFDRIEVRPRIYVWGDYTGYVVDNKKTHYEKHVFGEGLSCTLRMTNKFPNKKFFVQILAHEMVHHYQFTREEPFFQSKNISHGKSFWKWKPTFEKHGLNLRRVAIAK